MEYVLQRLQAMALVNAEAVPIQWAVVAALMVGMMGVVLLRSHRRQPQPEDESEAGHSLRTRLAKSLAPAQVEA